MRDSRPTAPLILAVLAVGAACYYERRGTRSQSVQRVAPVPDDEPQSLPPPRTTYMGREIAQTMHWRGAEWLLRETREKEERVEVLLDALGVEPGDVVCDLGCGNGYHTLRLARRVAPGGKVYAVDLQPEMLQLLKTRADREGIDNVLRIQGGPADPYLPPQSCDLVLLVDVYHELGYPERMLRAIRATLRPSGRLVLVEFRGEDPEVPIKPLHKMTKAQILAEIPPNGFRLVEEFDDLPWQHAMFFVRDDSPRNR